MTPNRIARVWVVGAVAATLLVSAAAAHHGWNWAADAQIELSGTIRDVYVGPPHPRLEVVTSDDGVWSVELGNPRQTAAAGFDESTAKAGDRVIALGHRSTDASEKRLKAVRITLDGRNYDFYPERIRQN